MILKSQRNIYNEGLSINKLYPVIAYEMEKKTNISKVQIIDDYRGLSWHCIDYFDVISNKTMDYVKVQGEKGEQYIYISFLEKDFFANYYMEDENAVSASLKLEKVLVSILSNELTKDELRKNLDIIGYKDDSTDLILKAFFNNVNSYDIIDFSKEIYNKVAELRGHIIKIIVEKLRFYKEPEIESLFIELYMNDLCHSKDVADIINEYLGV